MRFYLATSLIFPRSLRLRLFSVCFIATHIPLLTYIGWGAATGRITLAEFITLTLATIAGTALALFGIGALLSPIHALAATLHGEKDRPLPDVGDVIQTLYAGVHRAADTTRAQMDVLHLAANEDPLTGIANRRGFLSQIKALGKDARRGTIAILDIDHFKQVNDINGHDEGDRILCAFAERLLAQIRRADILARWGGEEFILFFAGSSEDEASWTLARIASLMREEPIGDVTGRPISFSAGLCRWSGGELDDALRFADQALYDAKLSGRDRICRACAV